jgi:hypothetical protein
MGSGSGHARYFDEAGNEFLSNCTTHVSQTFDLNNDSAAHGTTVVVVRDLDLTAPNIGGHFLLRSIVTSTIDPSGRQTEFQIHNEFVCA